MTARQTSYALLVVLIALAWGAREWIEWQWNTLSADAQLRWFALGWLFFTLVFSRIFTPFVWQNFS